MSARYVAVPPPMGSGKESLTKGQYRSLLELHRQGCEV